MRLGLITALAVALLCGTADAAAHGDWPAKHGGQMNNDRGEISFELAVRGGGVVVYLGDHGQDLPTGGARAVLTVWRGDSSWSTDMKDGGGNRLVGRLPQPIRKEDRVVLNVSFPNGSIGQGRFLFGVPDAGPLSVRFR